MLLDCSLVTTKAIVQLSQSYIYLALNRIAMEVAWNRRIVMEADVLIKMRKVPVISFNLLNPVPYIDPEHCSELALIYRVSNAYSHASKVIFLPFSRLYLCKMLRELKSKRMQISSSCVSLI